MESTNTRIPVQFKPPRQCASPVHINTDDEFSSNRLEPMLTMSHRNTVASAEFDSVLSEIHHRYIVSDSISDELEGKLQTKNQQLSQNNVLLQRSREMISQQQRLIDDERVDKCTMKLKIKDLSKEKFQLQCANKEMDAALTDLRHKMESTDFALHDRVLTIQALQSDLSELKASNDQLCKQSQLSANNFEKESNETTRTIENLKRQVAANDNERHRLTELCAKEEKAKKHAEKEAQLVIQQGQSLMEQQTAIRSQYQEDVEGHLYRIKTLENLIGERMKYYNQMEEQQKSQDKLSQEKIQSLNEKVTSLYINLKNLQELHKQENVGGQADLANLHRQLKAKIDSENVLQRKVSALNEQNIDAEQKLLGIQDELANENEGLRAEIASLKNYHTQEISKRLEEFNEIMKKEKSKVDTRVAEFNVETKSFRMEILNLKCSIAELEDKLEQKTAIQSSLKDTIQELQDTEQKISTELAQTKENHDKVLSEKAKEIDSLTTQLAHTKDDYDKVISDKVKDLDSLTRQFENAVQQNENKDREIDSLESKVKRLTEKNMQFNKNITDQLEELSSLKNAYEEAKKTTELIPSIKALLSRKESSKAILLAEQQNLEKEYSVALSRKTSEVNNLEQEVTMLQNENAALRAKTDSGMTDTRKVTNEALPIPKRSFGSSQAAFDTFISAKRQSSNQILAAENVKVKAELKNANTWWSRDVNELQRRNVAQIATIGQMERRLTLLETENDNLKQVSGDTEIRAELANKGATRATGYEQVVDHYHCELSIKESKIQTLEASLRHAQDETSSVASNMEIALRYEQDMMIAQGGKLSHNEIETEKIQCNLAEAELLLELNDQKNVKNILRQSNTDLQVLLENSKQANQSASSTLQLATEKQLSLVKLHKEFSHTLEQLQSESATASKWQQNEIEGLRKHYEDQICLLRQTTQQMMSDCNSKSKEMTSLATQKIESETTLCKANNQLREFKIRSNKVHQDLEVAQAAKAATAEHAIQLQEKLEQLQASYSQLETQLRLCENDSTISNERKMAELRSLHEGRIAKDTESHRKQILDYSTRLKLSAKENGNLLAEVNRLQERVNKESQPLEREIQELHGKVQKLVLEKGELQEHFKNGLAILKGDHEVILKDRTNEIHRLNCRISELETMNEVIKEDHESYRANADKIQRELQQLKLEKVEDTEQINAKLVESKRKAHQLTEDTEMLQRQLASALDKYTKSEIECVKLQHNCKLEVQQRRDASERNGASIEKLKCAQSEKNAQNKQLQLENKQFKCALRTAHSERKLDEEKLMIAKEDLQHAQSIRDLYKTQYDTARKESKAISNENYPMRSSTSINPIYESLSSQFHSTVQTIENSDGLGARIAELTNQVTHLKNATCQLKKQLELTETRLQDQTASNTNLKSLLESVTSQRNEYQESVEQLNEKLRRLQSDVRQETLQRESLQGLHNQKIDEIQRLQQQLVSVEQENEVLQKQLRDSAAIIERVNSNRISESELAQVRKKLNKERQNSFEIEQRLRDQALGMQNERAKLKRDVDEAHELNESLEKHILSLRRSFCEIYSDTDIMEFSNTNRPSPPSTNLSTKRRSWIKPKQDGGT